MSDILNDKHWHIEPIDCIQHLFDSVPQNSVDHAVFSPPFPTLYAYTSQPEDIGNSEGFAGEAKMHLRWFYNSLAPIIKPGRVACVHVMQVPKMKRADEEGLNDFRGINIRAAQAAGLIFKGEALIRKNPQAQAIKTKSHELQFAGLERDRANCRPTLCDYLLIFKRPGDNAVPVSNTEVSRNDWIAWAEGAWFDIIETDTLNVKEGRGDDDTKHICPLQLEVIRRSILMYSMPGEIIFSPFTGLGSEGYMALGGVSPKTKRFIREPRRFYGCEIKPEYLAAAAKNLQRAEQQSAERMSDKMLF